jgi:hypothetical protein
MRQRFDRIGNKLCEHPEDPASLNRGHSGFCGSRLNRDSLRRDVMIMKAQSGEDAQQPLPRSEATLSTFMNG